MALNNLKIQYLGTYINEFIGWDFGQKLGLRICQIFLASAYQNGETYTK
jgi:hypothetical protein